MRFDPNDEKLFFSDIQELSPEERDGFLNYQRSKDLEMLKNSFTLKRSGGGFSPKTAVALGIVAAVVAAFIITWKLDMPRVTVGLFGGLWLLGGIYLFFSKKQRQVYTPNSANMKQSTTGGFIFAIGLVITGGAVLSNYFSLGKVSVVCGGALFTVCGLLFFCSSAADKLRSSALIGEQTSGECIGYVRGVGTNSETSHTYVVTSAVFRYYRDGQWLEAIDSYHHIGGASPFAVGQTVDLTIDRKDPYFITSVGGRPKSKAGSFMELVFPLIFVVVGVGLLWFGLTHEISDSQVRTNNSSKATITDEAIEQKTGGQDWRAELITVTEKKYDSESDLWYIYYGDDQFIMTSEDIAKDYQVGESYYFIRYADSEGICAVYPEKSWNYDASKDYEDLRGGKKSKNTF